MAANGVESQAFELENRKKAVVTALYAALAGGDAENVRRLVASDLEWWFHGPQNCQHMMRMLTGECSQSDSEFEFKFKFEPRSITTIDDDRVIAEGWEGVQAYWVHVWTLNKDGVITQLREYFNTWLTVTEFRPLVKVVKSPTIWESQSRDLAKRSLPGLVLAI